MNYQESNSVQKSIQGSGMAQPYGMKTSVFPCHIVLHIVMSFLARPALFLSHSASSTSFNIWILSSHGTNFSLNHQITIHLEFTKTKELLGSGKCKATGRTLKSTTSIFLPSKPCFFPFSFLRCQPLPFLALLFFYSSFLLLSLFLFFFFVGRGGRLQNVMHSFPFPTNFKFATIIRSPYRGLIMLLEILNQ